MLQPGGAGFSGGFESSARVGEGGVSERKRWASWGEAGWAPAGAAGAVPAGRGAGGGRGGGAAGPGLDN